MCGGNKYKITKTLCSPSYYNGPVATYVIVNRKWLIRFHYWFFLLAVLQNKIAHSFTTRYLY